MGSSSLPMDWTRGPCPGSTGPPIQFSSVAQSCLTLCDPMNHNTPGLPVHHQLPESTQTHFHWVGDAIQPSHPLSSPSPPALSLSQHQGLFRWVSSSNQEHPYFGLYKANNYSPIKRIKEKNKDSEWVVMPHCVCPGFYLENNLRSQKSWEISRESSHIPST